MNRHLLLKNALSTAGQTVVQTVVLLLVYRYLIDRLGIDMLGVWAVVLATTSVARVSELGLAGSVTKYVSTYRARGDDGAAGEVLQTAAISLGGLLAIILLMFYPGLVWLMPHVLPDAALADAVAILPYALASMWLAAISGIWLGGLDGCLRSDVRAGLVIVSTVLFMGMVLATVPSYGLIGLAISQVAQGVTLVVLGWAAVVRIMPVLPPLPIRWSRVRFREMVGYGMNIQVVAVVMLLFEPTTKVLFARYGGLAAAGHFEMAQQLVMKARALIVESNRVVVPVIAGLDGTGQGARRFYSRNVSYMFFLLTPCFAALTALVPAISEVWIGEYQRQFVTMAVLLTIAWYINGLSAPAYFAYLGHGTLRWVTWSHILLGIANVLLGVSLGTAFGWEGVIAAFALSLMLGSVMLVWMYEREHQLRLAEILSRSDAALAAVCAAAASAALAGYSAALFMGTTIGTRLVVALAMVAVIGLATWRHPLAAEMLSMVKGAASRKPDGTQ